MQVELKTGSWTSDSTISISLPPSSSVSVHGSNQPPVSTSELADQIKAPIKQYAGKKVVVLIDDMSRPTPTAELLMAISKHITDFKVVIATGTHFPHHKEEKRFKSSGFDCEFHDCTKTEFIGKTTSGTPVWVNQTVRAAEVIVGIGCNYPHPSAGYSGGTKILAPGVLGIETIRILHDYFRGSVRGGATTVPFRKESAEIADMVGLDCLINVIVNCDRQIAKVFAGHPEVAFRSAAEFAARVYQVPQPIGNVIISDAYPFDINFNYANGRAMWPFRPGAINILIAKCELGLGDHRLFPTSSNEFFHRVTRRLKHFNVREFMSLGRKLRSITSMRQRRRMKFFLVSDLPRTALKQIFPNAIIVKTFQEIPLPDRATIDVYKCAPLHYTATQ